MSDPHLHPVGSWRMGAMEQCPLFFFPFFIASGRQKSETCAQISLQILCNTCPSSLNVLHFFHLCWCVRLLPEPPHVSSSSFPHILHTFHVLMTPKRRFFSPPLCFPLLILYFPSVCFFFFLMTGPNCKHPRRNYIRKHPVLNEREETGRR